jgi:hypothetical protein
MPDLLQLSPSIMVHNQPELLTRTEDTFFEDTFFPDLDLSDWTTEGNAPTVGNESQHLGQLSNSPVQLPPAEGLVQHNQLPQCWDIYSPTSDLAFMAQHTLHAELAVSNTTIPVENDFLAVPNEMQNPYPEVLSTGQHDPTHSSSIPALMGIADCIEGALSDVAVQQPQPISDLPSSTIPYGVEILAASETQSCVQKGNHGVQTTDIVHEREPNSADQAQKRGTVDITSPACYPLGHRDRDCPIMGLEAGCNSLDMGGLIFTRHDTQEGSTSRPIVFDDKKVVSKKEPPHRRIASKPPLNAQISPQRIQKPNLGGQRPVFFIQESGRGHQVLLDPPPKMGRRIGPLPQQKAKKVADARKRGVCIRCKLSKRTVSCQFVLQHS